jgi:hypothetical protein
MGFKSGADWNGNKSGRPKNPDFRAKFTQELIEANFETTRILFANLGEQAVNGDRWAVEKYLTYMAPYSLLKPKSEMEVTETNNSEIVEMLSTYKKDTLVTIHKMLSEEVKDV